MTAMKILFFFFVLTVSFSLCAKLLEVNVEARSAILMNANTGVVLYDKHSRARSFPASLTKIATALYILENQRLPLDKLVKVSEEALKMKIQNGEGAPYRLIYDGTSMGLRKGEEVSVEALLHGLLMISGNDAANVLAEAHSGSIPKFIEEMNQYLRNTVGCQNTQFCSPHGIHSDEHFTCAYDLALIAKRALRIPKFREITSKVTYRCPKTNKRPSIEIRHLNALIKKGRHYYPKAIGIKTGTFSSAGKTIIAAAEHEGRVLVAILLGCPKSDDRYKGAKLLFETAFQEKEKKLKIIGSERVFHRKILDSSDFVRVGLAEDLEVSFFPAEEPEYKAFVEWKHLQLPIEKGQKVAEFHLFDQDGNRLQTKDLFAKEAVKPSFLSSLKENVRSWVRKK